MKNLLLAATVAFFAFQFQAFSHDKPILFEQLPSKSQKFIKQGFAKDSVTKVTKDADLTETSYDVFLASGCKVEFRKNGDWEGIDCRKNPIPDEAIPSKICAYVKANYPNAHIVEIDKSTLGFEVELSNGLELKFNKKEKFLRIDQ